MKKPLSLKRATFVLLFALCAGVSTQAQSQRVTLKLTQATLKQVFQTIEKQTSYRFSYRDAVVSNRADITIDKKNAEVADVLRSILPARKLGFDIISDKSIVIYDLTKKATSGPKTKKKITGLVTDEKGEPIIGASVKVKGASLGTVTDYNGRYSIDAAQGDKLEISYIGFTLQEGEVGNNTTYNFTLKEDNQTLNELVVIGYGSVKKANMTSSVSKISSEALENRPVSNVSEAIQGQLAGVNAQATGGGLPGEELNIRIRGVNTINGDSSPLYVIDGVPRDNMSGVNPSDIATMQVLKDAAATAIYGSRGANGVVLIQTKEGKGKPQVTFNAYYGLQTAEKKLDLMTGEEWVAYQMWMRNANHLRAGGSMSDPMSARDMANRIPSWWSSVTEFTDWQSEVLQTAPIQSYEASASAGGDMGNIYLSLGYMQQEGIVKYTDYNRYNARVNGTLNIADYLRVGANLSFQSNKQDLGATNISDGGQGGKEGPLNHAMMMSPLIKPGTCIRTAENTEGNPNNYSGAESSEDYGAWWIDPLAQMSEATDRTETTRVQTNVFLEWDVLPKFLTYKVQFSNNYDGVNYEFFWPASVNRNGYTSAGYSSNYNTKDWVLQNTLTFDHQFGNHNVNVLLGQSAEKQKYYQADLTATGWPYETVHTLNMASTPTQASTERTVYANASFFGRLSYNYLERYLFTASVRRDGSSRFGKNTKWGTFPSFSAGWKINQEKFLRDVQWIDLLKIRASYGTSGNDRIGNYAYMAQLSTYNAAYGETLQAGAAASNIANADLKWEQTGSLDIGLDFSAFHNRLQFNFDYYVNTTKNLLFDVPTPYTTGFESQLTNIGKVRNKGWEIDITSHNLTGELKWNTNLNLSHNSNEVLELDGNQTQIITKLHGSYQFITQVGGPVSQFYVYDIVGFLTAEDIANGVPIASGEEEGNYKIVDHNGDGQITDADRIPGGSNLPDLTFGITNRFSWKNFELSVLVQGQFGGQVMYVGARHIDCGYGGRTSYSRWLNCYKTDLLKEAIPTAYCEAHGIDMSWDGNTQNQFNWAPSNDVYSSDYVRIKNITLSYTMPKKILRNTPISACRIYGSVDNVYTFTDYPGFTPETSTYGNGTTQLGVDYSTYPLSRRFTLGVNITF